MGKVFDFALDDASAIALASSLFYWQIVSAFNF